LSDTATTRQSDLTVRTLSAVALLAVVAVAIYFGGIVLRVLILIGALILLYEWLGLARKSSTGIGLGLWLLFGVVYIGLAAVSIVLLSMVQFLVPVLAIVIATDTGAYFAGRAIGGPKIAPSISPSKTWAGLAGGMVAAALAAVIVFTAFATRPDAMPYALTETWNGKVFLALSGAVLAVVAQAGDFFESALKRRAGVKDSGSFIPGHGGLFDRVDGLLPVAIVMGLVVTALIVNALTDLS
jgi:phosphatidate cytidylyltransferase